MAVEEAGEDRSFRKIDDFCFRGDGHVSADFFDLFSFHQDDLIGGGFSGLRVEQLAGFLT